MKKREKIKQALQDTELAETKHYSKRVAATVLTVFSVLSCVLAAIGVLYIRREFADPDIVRDWIDGNYFFGALVMLLICIAQVVIALIPGELVEIAAGYVFGPWWGMLICLVGAMIGSVLVILLVRRLGRKFVESIYPREKLDALPILNDPSKRNAFTALLFFIPGTPKDLLTYVIGLTEMSIPAYVLLTSVARIPSILMSTLGGDALVANRLTAAVIFFSIAAVLSLGGYLLYRHIQKRHAKQAKEDKNDGENGVS